MSEIAFLALGSNLGDRDEYLRFARREISTLPDTRLIAASRVEETAPLGGMDQPRYLNQMIAIETRLEPRELLQRLQAIEDKTGRERGERWGSRTLDVDIVLYDNVRLSGPSLTLPHPGLMDREFWRRQLADVRAALEEPL